MKGYIFDLDGVVVDTAKYHYLAWARLATELGFVFEQQHNEQLKGVSRMASLEIVLETGRITDLTEEEKLVLADRKNRYYLKMIETIGEEEILPGIKEYLQMLKADGKKIALGSASKSGKMILEQLHLISYFDAVVDGNLVSKAKPDSEVFVKAAELLDLRCSECVVIEDARAGIEAAQRAKMKTIGIGDATVLEGADVVFPHTEELIIHGYVHESNDCFPHKSA